jgi:hypothetical protein
MNKLRHFKDGEKNNDEEKEHPKLLRKKKVVKRKGNTKWTNGEYNNLINFVR